MEKALPLHWYIVGYIYIVDYINYDINIVKTICLNVRHSKDNVRHSKDNMSESSQTPKHFFFVSLYYPYNY